MRDPDKRIAKWQAKYNTDRVKSTLDEMRDEMAKNYKAAMTNMWMMEAKVKEVINACGVSTIQYVPYLNFGRQLYKVTRQRGITGESFAMAAQVLREKWAARGCDSEVLAKIRSEVFNIDAPGSQSVRVRHSEQQTGNW